MQELIIRFDVVNCFYAADTEKGVINRHRQVPLDEFHLVVVRGLIH